VLLRFNYLTRASSARLHDFSKYFFLLEKENKFSR